MSMKGIERYRMAIKDGGPMFVSFVDILEKVQSSQCMFSVNIACIFVLQTCMLQFYIQDFTKYLYKSWKIVCSKQYKIKLYIHRISKKRICIASK